MKTLAIALAVSLFPLAGFACSASYSAKVTCGTVKQLALKDGTSSLVGVSFSDKVVTGGVDASCNWVEETGEVSAEFVEVAELTRADAKKLLKKIEKLKGSEVCVFSTYFLDKNLAFVEPRGQQTTEQIMLKNVKKFKAGIQKQTGF